MSVRVTVRPEELARVRWEDYVARYNADTKLTWDGLTDIGRKPWLREAEDWLLRIKKNKRRTAEAQP